MGYKTFFVTRSSSPSSVQKKILPFKARPNNQPQDKGRFFSLPNFLTFMRLAFVPAILVLFLSDQPPYVWLRNGLFILAALTDCLDGYIARLWKQTSRLGTLLDPLADKLLILPVLVVLALKGILGGIHLVPFFLIMIREIAVPTLRETYHAFSQTPLKVHHSAQWKTTVEMLSIACLMVASSFAETLTWLLTFGLVMLYSASFLGLYSAMIYLKRLARKF